MSKLDVKPIQTSPTQATVNKAVRVIDNLLGNNDKAEINQAIDFVTEHSGPQPV